LINLSFGKDGAIFDGMLVPSVADRDLDFWVYSPSEYGPHIPLVEKVYQNEPIMLLMFVRAHPAGMQNHLDITYDLKMVREDHSISLNAPNNYFYKGKVINSLIMPNQVSDIWFDKKEPFGKYQIRAEFHEKISKRNYTATAELELIPFERPKSFKSKENYEEWLMNYFQRPEPMRSFAGILYDVQTDDEWIGDNYVSLAFYRRIFSDNPFLWEYYAQLYKTATQKEKEKMLIIAGLVESKEKAKYFVPIIEPSQMPVYEKAKKIQIPSTVNITAGEQLDVLWAEFFAGGKYKSIKGIVNGLALAKYKGSLEKMKNAGPNEKNRDIEKEAMLDAVYQSAIWSLVSNGTQFDLVNQYCRTIYKNEKLSPEVKSSLGAVIKIIEMKREEEIKRRNENTE
jgi:hypothetical protein